MDDLKNLTKVELINEVQQLRSELKKSEIARLENMAKESERRFTEIMKSVNLVSIILDTNGNIEFCNNFLLKRTGYNLNEILGKNWFDIFITDDISDQVKKVFIEAVSGGNMVANMENEIVIKNGDRLAISWNNTLLKDAEGKIIGVASLGEDITGKRKVNDLLKKSESRFSKMFDNATFGILICQLIKDDNGKDIDYIFLQGNDSIYNHLGVYAKHFIGKRASDIITVEETAYFIEKFAEVVKTGKPYEYTKYYPSFDRTVDNRSFYLEEDFFAVLFFDVTKQKQTEQAILKNKNRLDYALNIVKTGAWELDLKTMDSWRSFKHDQIFGYNAPLEEWTFELFMEHVIPEDRMWVNEKFQHALATKTGWNFECRIKRNNDGKIRWILANGNHELEGDQKSEKMFGIVQDITESKLTEKALLESEEKFRGIYEQSPIAIEVYDKDGKLVDVNQQTLDMFGVEDKKYVLGFNLWEDPNLTSEKMEALKNGKSIFISTDFDFEITKKNNLYPTSRSGIMYMDMYAIPIKQDKEISGYLVQTIEVTNRKNAEEATKKQKDMFELVINSVPTRIFWKDLNSVYLGCNMSFLEAVRKNKTEDVIGKNDFDLIWAQEAEKYINDDREVIEKGVPRLGYEESYFLPDGKNIWWQSSKMPLKDNTGKIIGILATSEDVTERKQAENEILKLNETFLAAQEMANIGNWSYNIEAEESTWSDQMYVIFGKNKEEGIIPYMEHKNFIHADDWEFFDKSVQDCIKGKPYNIVIRIFFPDNSLHYINTQGFARFDKKGAVLEIYGVTQDITKIKKAEEELLKHKENLEKTVEERTKDLNTKISEIERMNRLFVGRELRMKKLKEIIKEQKDKLDNI